MGRYFCLDNPDTLTLSTMVAASAPGRLLLRESPFYPGGGGQLADRGLLRWANLASTGASRPLRILKIDNKGRHNRRLRVGLEGSPRDGLS